MTGTAGPAKHSRWGRLAGAVVLLAPLLVVGSAAAPHGAADAVAAPSPADPAEAGRIAFAGTEHRSLGQADAEKTTGPLFGDGPTHYDEDPSARGGVLVFTSLRDSVRPQVYVRDADGTVRRLTTDRDAANPELSPDRRTVVFDSAEPGPGGTVQRDLWAVGVDGSDLRRLTDTPDNEESPTFSPDGSRIAYACDGDATRGWQIYVRALAGGEQTRISDGPPGDAKDPSWNPVDDDTHRNRIAYTHITDPDPEKGYRLRVTEGLGTDRPLLAGGHAEWGSHSVSWLPNGDDVLFLSPFHVCGCDDFDHVYRGPAFSEQTPDQLVSEDRDVASPTWTGSDSTTGEVIVSRISASAANVVTLQDVRQDGSDPRDLNFIILNEDPAARTNTDPALDPLFNPAAGYDPWTERQNYTPDGRRIVVTRFEGPDDARIQRIWMVDADGTNGSALPLAGRGERDWDTDPTFSPDGTKIAFTRTSPGGVGEAAGPGRILIADVASGAILDEIRPPEGQQQGRDAQPTWSSDGVNLAFTRTQVINGNGGNKHIWVVPVASLGQQRDLSATICPGDCEVIDDSPAFSPDGTRVAFNRKDGGGRINERAGIIVKPLRGGGCRVVLPSSERDNPDGCDQEIPDTTGTGPFQPRDVAWSPDGSRIVLSSRREQAVNSMEQLSVLDLASGELTPLDNDHAGRQKEPSYQQSVDLAVTAPPTGPAVEVGSSVEVKVTVVNHGPSPSPGTVFTADPPPGVRLEELTTPAGSCGAGSPQCDLGVVPPGASVEITAKLTGVTRGDQPIGWSVTGTVLDPNPTDNATGTLVPVQDVPPPTPTPTPPTPPTPTPPTPTPPTPTPAPPTTAPAPPPPPAPRPPAPRPPAPLPPAPLAGPGVVVRAQPSPGYVGGKVVVTYTVRNGRNATATGLRLQLGLPGTIPSGPLPAGCTAGLCTLPDLGPGASTVVRVVLSPDRALRTSITATLTTTGTDANRSDNRSRIPLRILQPRIIAVPAIGKPGFVTSVRGKDFPPGAPVKLSWKPGITAAAAPTLPNPDGTFIAQLLILAKDQTGPRIITAKGPGFSPVTTDFLVVLGTITPPDEVIRR
ncbi:hypothetical protein DBP19_24760 [Streptomyces sp. CS090A]|uniref:DUF11 domain-containing protein n=1 Tax=Streptomyces sp. CS090A TaxID=2162710 RepID=UPI000D508DF8|nr:DUF11 domain-containing protein [Streptomyces sp. CS090A]PVC87764.1 hypothetical protein DBP19_24760 [Streptomyces sp. CS090A]